jgi:hypothetical protein
MREDTLSVLAQYCVSVRDRECLTRSEARVIDRPGLVARLFELVMSGASLTNRLVLTSASPADRIWLRKKSEPGF